MCHGAPSTLGLGSGHGAAALVRYQCLFCEGRELTFHMVNRVVRFEAPLELHSLGAKPLSHCPHVLSNREVRAICDSTCMFHHDGQALPVSEWLAHASCELDFEITSVSEAIFLWAPLAHLVVHGHWDVVGASRAVDRQVRSRIFAMMPPARMRAALQCAWDERCMPGSVFDEVAFMIAGETRSGLGNFGEAGDDGDLQIREGMASFLFGFGRAFAPGVLQLGACAATQGRTRTFHSLVLCKCLRLAGFLRGAGTMREVLERALDVLLPKHVASVIRDAYRDTRIPHESVLSRFRIVLDCGMMMWMRKVNAELHNAATRGGPRVCRCLLSDSSPQGLENWQISETYLVADAVKVAGIVDELVALSKRLVDDPGDDRAVAPGEAEAEGHDDVKDKYAALTQALAAGMQHHILPPTGLGFRKSNLAHKLNAVLHSIHNESASLPEPRLANARRAFHRLSCRCAARVSAFSLPLAWRA